jgi:hypothetical protein
MRSTYSKGVLAVMDLKTWFDELRQQSLAVDPSELYLWPRTPVANLQAEIWQRVGVSDWRIDNPLSRSYKVSAAIRDLQYNQLIPTDAKVLDICCGDGVVLGQVAGEHPAVECYGLDLYGGERVPLRVLDQTNVTVSRAAIQHLFVNGPPQPFDVAWMLNTYRGWDSAELRPEERDLPALAERWLWHNARYTIVTATKAQAKHLRRAGWWVSELGQGEDDSTMLLLWPARDQYGG